MGESFAKTSSWTRGCVLFLMVYFQRGSAKREARRKPTFFLCHLILILERARQRKAKQPCVAQVGSYAVDFWVIGEAACLGTGVGWGGGQG